MKDLKYIIALVLVLASFSVFAGFDPAIDLAGSKAIAQGRCAHKGYIYTCFAVEKDDKKYLVQVDSKGFVAVYAIKEIKPTYEVSDAELVWERKNYTKDDV